MFTLQSKYVKLNVCFSLLYFYFSMLILLLVVNILQDVKACQVVVYSV